MGNHMSRQSPSRVGNWLIGRVVNERNREAVLGDLAEEYVLRARSTDASTVSLWYWGQVCRSLPPLLWAAFKGGRWLPTLIVAMGAYIVAGLFEFAATAALAKLMAPDGRIFTLLVLTVGLMSMMMSGYLAAWVRPGAATVLAGIVLLVVAILMVRFGDSVPWWYQLAFLTMGPLAAFGGGSLCMRQRKSRIGHH